VTSQLYSEECIKEHSLPKKSEVGDTWMVKHEYKAYSGSEKNPNRAAYRILELQNGVAEELIQLVTHLSNSSPQRIVAMDHRRWSGERKLPLDG
jgi:hypothetical protein